MTKKFTALFSLFCCLWLAGGPVGRAQALDPTFQPTVLKAPFTSSSLFSVNTLAVQPDGKVLAAGGFDFVNGVLTGKLHRFNSNGTPDAGFNAGTGANGFIAAVVLQPDGKILVAGGFSIFNGVVAPNLVRLNPDGSLDNTFSSIGTGVPRQPMSLVLQPDGKILVSGTALDVQQQTVSGVVRLLPSGARDTSFSPGTGVDGGFAYCLLVQPDSKILVGGVFTTFNGQPTGGLVRLNPDGSLDPSFRAGISPGGAIRSLLLQPNGKVLVGGTFELPSTTFFTRLARLLPDGALDNTFTPGAGPNMGSVISMIPQSAGGAVLVGSFTQYDGVARGRLARISADGVLDASFAPDAGANNSVLAVAETGTNELFVGGGFTQFNGFNQPALARLSSDGSFDGGFTPLLEARGAVTKALPLPNGQFLVSGYFNSFNGTLLAGQPTVPRRLNADGSLDPSFMPAAVGTLQDLAPGGGFYLLDANSLALRRLQTNGAVDNGFTTRALRGRTTGTTTGAISLTGAVVQADGKVLLYGSFSSYDNVPRNGVVRVLSDGSLDASFTPPASATLPATPSDFRRVTALHVLPTGKILCQWTYFQGSSQSFLIQLNPDGTLDNTFSVGTGPATSAGPSFYYNVLPQPDGRILLAGDFTSINGQATPHGVARLTSNGALDASFTGITQNYLPRAMQADGRILATTGGNTSLSNATSVLVRLNADGSRDASFAAVALPSSIFIGDDLLTGLVIQPADGKIILYGSFRYVAGQVRFGLARLTNTILATRATVALQPLTVYPNPACDVATVQLPATAVGQHIWLLDMNGRLVRQHRWPAGQAIATLALHDVPAGVYLVQVAAATGLYQTRVVVTP